jgi:predicted nucleic acid-binding protein
MRNSSAEILRAVAAGESVQVTNHGQLAAVISPPVATVLDELVARGLARPPRRSRAELLVIVYLDTSAAMKLLVEEAESAALVTFLESMQDLDVVASWLLHTELHCAANRHPDDVDKVAVGVVLDTVTLIDLARGDLLTAAAVPGRLRSNDAVHLAVALRVGVDAVATYDSELAAAAALSGLSVLHPT